MRITNFFLAAMLLMVGTVSAQQMPELPTDKEVRVGKLDNGLTYYLRYNNTPKKKANFYIAQRVGSVQEEDTQRGLAHFLEHMAFNGSEHFPTGKMVEYLQTIGVEYGRSLNAYTSFDRTVYYVADVSTERQSALDSCMLVLRDWSSGITITQEEIEKERDVIHNEYRYRTAAADRMLERALPTLFQGSKYGYRMPIGTMEVVDNFKPEELEAYYRKWYRPDNQALVVVGDIDVDYTENLIKKLFSDIKVAPDAAQVVDELVPDNEQPIFVAEKDKELPYPILRIGIKRDVMPVAVKKTAAYLVTDYLCNLVCRMLSARLDEISQQPECPYLQAIVQNGKLGNVVRTKDAVTLIGVSKHGQEIETLKSLEREILRARKFGFTATEYARAKADYLSALERDYDNRDKRKNAEYANEYIENYLEQTPIPSLEERYQIISALAQQLPVDIVNQVIRQMIPENDKNLLAFYMQQEKEGNVFVTAEEMKAGVDAVHAETLTAWVDNVKEEPLIADLPVKGQIVKETENKTFGYKELTLSNGARVILKKTDFKDNEVMMQAEAKGGASLFVDTDPINVDFASTVAMFSGLGNFTKSELDKALAGKQASVSLSIDEDRQYISGRSTPKDLETLFQLTYLTMTNINKDEKSVAAFINQAKTVFGNKSLNHDLVFKDSVESTLHCGNRFYVTPEAEELSQFDYDRTLQILKQLYGHGGQFIYTIIGNFDEQQIRTLIEQYIASLPGGSRDFGHVRDIRTFFKGEKVNQFSKKMETPQAQVREIWLNEDMAYTLENKVMLNAVSQVLTRVYERTIREEESAVYGVGAGGRIDLSGSRPVFILNAAAPTNPDKMQIARDLMVKFVAEATQKIADEDLNAVKEIMLKQAQDNARENGHWMDVLTEWTAEGVDLQTGYEETVKSLTSEKLQKFLADLVSAGNHAEIVMMPEK